MSRSATRFASVSNQARELDALTLDELKQFGDQFSEDFYAAITVEAALDCHDVVGGTARHRVHAALQDARQRIG